MQSVEDIDIGIADQLQGVVQSLSWPVFGSNEVCALHVTEIAVLSLQMGLIDYVVEVLT
jgi:hypothetical protein